MQVLINSMRVPFDDRLRIFVLAVILGLAAAGPMLHAQTTYFAPAAARIIVKYRENSPLLKEQVASETFARSLRVTALGKRIGITAVSALRDVGDKVGFSDLGPEIAISEQAETASTLSRVSRACIRS
jgi:hypothetical protein